MHETRHLERRETLAHWPVRQDDTGTSVGLVSDMSTEGIQIHSDHVISKGQQLSLCVSVEPKLCGRDQLCLQVENVWCQRSGASGLYHAGCKIVALSRQARLCIERLMMGFSYSAPSQHALVP